MYEHLFKVGNGNNQWTKNRPKGKAKQPEHGGLPADMKPSKTMDSGGGAVVKAIGDATHKAITAKGYQFMTQADSAADGMNSDTMGGAFLVKRGGKTGVYGDNDRGVVLTHKDIEGLVSKVKKTDAPGVQRQAQVAEAFTRN